MMSMLQDEYNRELVRHEAEESKNRVVDGMKRFFGMNSKSNRSRLRLKMSEKSEPFHYVRQFTRSLMKQETDESIEPRIDP